LLIQPLAGRLSDFTGRRPVMMFFGICGTLFTYPIFATLAHTNSAVAAFALVMAGLVMLTGYTSINAIVKAELFPADIRALGVALPYALANTMFGGTAEYIALWLKNAGHEPWFYIYISLLSAIYLICVLRMRETRETSQILED
jgi:MHS family alpha-ketoglutarate permease-like MFS transporter